MADLSDVAARVIGWAGDDEEVAAYVARNGMPDVAEWHFLADRPPWDDHEVTLYYLDARTKISFARASIRP